MHELIAGILRFLATEVVYSSLLFALVLAVTALLGDRLPALRYGLWALVLVRLVLPTDLAAPWSARALLTTETALPDLPEAVMESGGALDVLTGTTAVVAGTPLWKSIAFTAWAFGAFAALLLVTRRIRQHNALIANARTITEPTIRAMSDSWRRELGVRRSVRLVTSDDFLSPFTTGHRSPVIFLPEALLTNDELMPVEAAIAHEMAHVKRRDALWLRVINLIQIVYFFHPVVWATLRRLNDSREEICDHLVLDRHQFSSRDYGRSLLTVLSLELEPAHPLAVAGMSDDKRRFSMRIRQILSHSKRPASRSFSSALVALAAGALLLPMAEGVTEPPPARQVAANAAAAAADWMNPVPEGAITSYFGARTNPFDKATESHGGVDVAAPTGTLVSAPASGTVTIATTNLEGKTSWGTVLIIDHGDGIRSVYAHLGTLEVERGDRVEAGQTIATVGSTGRSTGPHVHFEVRENGERVDPLAYITGWKNRND